MADITITQLMGVAGNAAVKSHGFRFTPVRELSGGGWAMALVDPATGVGVGVTWSQSDEDRYPTEDHKISLCTSLIENAIDALTHTIRSRPRRPQ